MAWADKDPDETLDYQVNWADELGADTISTSTWTVPAGITSVLQTSTTTTATIWLSGGTDGTRYDLINKIVTAGARTFETVVSLRVREKTLAIAPALDATVGGASADSYVTVLEYQTYAAKQGWTLGTATEADLRRARLYLDRSYSWKGYIADQEQALAWPRVTGVYVEGYPVDSDIIPQRVKDAQMELAYLIQSGETPFAVLSVGAILSKREKVDVIEDATTYSEATARDRAAYPVVDQLVAPYVFGKAGQRGSMRIIRA